MVRCPVLLISFCGRVHLGIPAAHHTGPGLATHRSLQNTPAPYHIGPHQATRRPPQVRPGHSLVTPGLYFIAPRSHLISCIISSSHLGYTLKFFLHIPKITHVHSRSHLITPISHLITPGSCTITPRSSTGLASRSHLTMPHMPWHTSPSPA